jgi:hypothetical protein
MSTNGCYYNTQYNIYLYPVNDVNTEYNKSLSYCDIEPVEGASYGFELNSNGYWESNNKGRDYSAALCKVKIVNKSRKRVFIDVINYAESNFDYGIFSNLNKTLNTSYDVDSSANTFASFKGKSDPSVQTLDYGIVPEECFIYIKFRKDSSSANGNDSLQFKIRFEEIETPCAIVEPVEGATYGFNMNSNGYWESNNKGQDSTSALCKVTIVNPEGKNVCFDCINFAESGWDFGILSKVGETLDATSNVDDSSKIQKSFKENNSSSVYTVSYGVLASESVIYVKFRKDTSSSSNNDSLQFKVVFY